MIGIQYNKYVKLKLSVYGLKYTWLLLYGYITFVNHINLKLLYTDLAFYKYKIILVKNK